MFVRNAIVGLAMGAGALAFEYAEDIFFIVSHGQLTATRLDPIMSPGAVSGHVHAIAGGANFGPTYNYDNSLKSACTTANIAVDHSNYWVPQLYNKNDNGTFSLAGLSYVNTYYQMRRTGKEPVYEFPPGFRMLAGDQNRRTSDLSDPAQDAVRYVCLGGNTPEGHAFPPEQCKDGLRAQVYFPHCWDGINSWLEGSKHVSYGEGQFDQGGKCPPTHPKRIMGLFYEFIFHDHAAYKPGGRVWSNGDETGYALHADFTNGWPTGFFSEIFSYGKQCSVGFGLDECPALAPHIVKNQQCTYSGVMVNEDIGDRGAIPRLPGNNPAVAGYQEKSTFSKGSPAPVNIAAVKATGIIMATVKGDPAQSAPPNAIPQTGVAAASSTSSVISTSVAATPSAVVPSASAGSSVISSDRASSAMAVSSNRPSASASSEVAVSSSRPTASTSSALPGGGAVLIGASGSVSASGSASASISSSASASASVSSSSSSSASAASATGTKASEPAPIESAPTATDTEDASTSMADSIPYASDSSVSSAAGIPAPASSLAATRPRKSCGRGGRHGRKKHT